MILDLDDPAAPEDRLSGTESSPYDTGSLLPNCRVPPESTR
jgi:hypothetical protein